MFSLLAVSVASANLLELGAKLSCSEMADQPPPPKKKRMTIKAHFIAFLQKHAKPVSEEELKSEFPNLAKVVPVMQPLLKSGNLQISKQNGEQFYAWVDDKKAASLKGLTDDQKYVYQIIATHGNRGVHMRDLKFKSSQTLPDLKLALRKLKSKQLIKTINDIDNKTRQIHILFELDPHPDCTGGVWYSESEFDMALIKEARKAVIRLLMRASKRRQTGLSVGEIAAQLKSSRIFDVELGAKDILQLLTTMELDLKVKRVVPIEDSASASASASSPEETVFKIATQAVHFNFVTDFPCGTCPVYEHCVPGGTVSPETCPYLNKWLKGADDW